MRHRTELETRTAADNILGLNRSLEQRSFGFTLMLTIAQ